MTLVGKTLGHYEILERLGAGGMGEVYRARDTKLERDVAIKVLSQEFAGDADRLARLEREAKLLASLNHPHIATIHSLEESEETRFLVLELVKGESLEQTLSRGALPVQAALEICRQVAEALEAAHQEGIVHRDLKPANVLVTTDKRAKVLDFGIAKVQQHRAGTNTAQLTNLTLEGTLIGTAPYMSPEQVRSEAVDKRSDVWAFGCLLFETLAGRRAFARETVADTLAAIIELEPDWGRLPSTTPPLVRSVLLRCLRKDPHRRLHDIADVRIELQDALDESSAASPSVVGDSAASRSVPQTLSWGAIGDIQRRTLALLTFDGDNSVPVWSPDGERVAFSSGRYGSYNLMWKRADGGGDAEVLLRQDNGQFPISFSLDGRLLAFYEVNPVTKRDIWVLPLEGDRTPIPFLATPANERAPMFSPDGRWLAYVSDESGRDETYVQSYPGPGGRQQISPDGGTEPLWAPSGRELFYRIGDRVMVVDIEPGSGLKASAPRELFEAAFLMSTPVFAYPRWDVSSDGERFLMVMSEPAPVPSRLSVVFNWFEELVPLATQAR